MQNPKDIPWIKPDPPKLSKAHQKRWASLVSILYHPQAAWKIILSENPYTDYMFWLILYISSLVLSAVVVVQLGVAFHRDLIQYALVLGLLTFLNVIMLSLASLIYGAVGQWVGYWLGGSGGFKKMLTIAMWAGLPIVYNDALCWMVLLLGGEPLRGIYDSFGPKSLGTQGLMLFWVTMVAGFGFAEAHQVSIKKGLIISAVVTLPIPMLVIILNKQ